MMLADRTPKPQVREMKRQYQMIRVGAADENSFYVSNKFLFTNVNEFDMAWELVENGGSFKEARSPYTSMFRPRQRAWSMKR